MVWSITETATSQPAMDLMGSANEMDAFNSDTAMDSSQDQGGQSQVQSQNDPWHPKSYSQVSIRGGRQCKSLGVLQVSSKHTKPKRKSFY